jgi:tetratricopeptide (TPR) repeat protein
MTINIREIMMAGLLLAAAAVMAQPAPVKNAAKAVFTLTTFKADGQLLASSHGVFVDANGTALSDWSSFEGAASAVVIDATGKRFDVDYMIGANEIYDVAKFHVNGKTNGATIATTGAPEGATVYLLGYSVKKPEISTTKIDKVETFMDKYHYYIIKSVLPDNTQSCPLVNDAGQVLGFVQHSQYTTDNHATDAMYINDMQVTGLSFNDPVLRRTNIPTQIPDDKEQARVALMLSTQTVDSAKYTKMVDMIVEKFPDLPDGYTALAQRHLNANDFAAVDRVMETAIKNVPEKDVAYFSYARLIYQKEVYKSGIPYPAWSLDKAFEQAQKAYEVNPQPLYQHLQAQILYSKEKYQDAHDQFMALTKSDLRNPELFYEAAQCKKRLNGTHEEVIELLDSAINCFKKPYTPEAAPYFYARAGELNDKGEYRKAVADYNQYDTLMQGRHPADFYYVREQSEVKGRLYQQALIDIEIATRLAPTISLYWAEKGNLLLRLKEPKAALESAEQSIALEPEYSDAYLIKGLAQIQLGDKKAGLETLNKANELGNEQAPALIEKYK